MFIELVLWWNLFEFLLFHLQMMENMSRWFYPGSYMDFPFQNIMKRALCSFSSLNRSGLCARIYGGRCINWNAITACWYSTDPRVYGLGWLWCYGELYQDWFCRYKTEQKMMFGLRWDFFCFIHHLCAIVPVDCDILCKTYRSHLVATHAVLFKNQLEAYLRSMTCPVMLMALYWQRCKF